MRATDNRLLALPRTNDAVGEGVRLGDSDGEGEGLPDGSGVREGLREAEGLGVAEGDGEGVGVGEAEQVSHRQAACRRDVESVCKEQQRFGNLARGF